MPFRLGLVTPATRARLNAMRLVAIVSERLVITLPAIFAGLYVAWVESSPRRGLVLALVLSSMSLYVSSRTRRVLVRRLRTISGSLECFRGGDFSVRPKDVGAFDLFEDLIRELNQLGDALRDHRLDEVEAWALLRKVLTELHVVAFAFSMDGAVTLATEAATKCLGKPASALLGKQAAELGLLELISGDAPRLIDACEALGPGQWELRRGTVRLAGRPHRLAIVSDLGDARRLLEREAWQRLIRVMGHEINNSLAPIQSISESLLELVASAAEVNEWRDDARQGLSIIARRSQDLGRFIAGYGRLARLPPPKLEPVDVGAWVQRCVELDQRVNISVEGGCAAMVLGDAAQLDQLLINLLRNAVEASQEREASVRVHWKMDRAMLELIVEDDGFGVTGTGNLFVPFFTTKPGGSGIGLALARQIAAGHGGNVLLRNRLRGSGAEAVVRLPRDGR